MTNSANPIGGARRNDGMMGFAPELSACARPIRQIISMQEKMLLVGSLGGGAHDFKPFSANHEFFERFAVRLIVFPAPGTFFATRQDFLTNVPHH